MDNTKDDIYLLDKIRYCISRIEKVMSNVSYEVFCNNEEIQESTMFNLIQISEFSKKYLTNIKIYIMKFLGLLFMV